MSTNKELGQVPNIILVKYNKMNFYTTLKNTLKIFIAEINLHKMGIF